MQVITESNCIRIGDALIPKSSVTIVAIENGVRVGNVELMVDDTTIDGVAVESVSDLLEYFVENGFKNGGGESGEGDYVKISDVSMMPVADKIPKFSSQGLLSTGMAEFPENAISLAYLDVWSRGYSTLDLVMGSHTLTINDVGSNKALVLDGVYLVLSLPTSATGLVAGFIVNLVNISDTLVEVSTSGTPFTIISKNGMTHVSEKSSARLVYLGSNIWFLEGELTSI